MSTQTVGSAKFLELDQSELVEILNNAQAKLNEVGVSIPHQECILTIAYLFMKQSLQYVATTQTEINFCQLFDMGIDEEDLSPYMVAGQEFKLLIKSDEESEDE